MMKIEFPETGRYSCLMCGRCCRTSIISLTAEEAGRLSGAKTPRPTGVTVRKYRTARGDSFRMEPLPDGSCPFLDGANRCSIHASEGFERKPLTCRLFPFFFARIPTGVRASLRFNCPAVALGAGEHISGSRRSMENLAAELEKEAGIPSLRDRVGFDDRRSISFGDIDLLARHALKLVTGSPGDPAGRLAAASEFSFLVARSGIESESRFKYWQAMADGSAVRFKDGCAAPWLPNVMERALLRQAAYAISSIPGQAVLRAGPVSRVLGRAGAAAGAVLYSAGFGGMRGVLEKSGVPGSISAAAEAAAPKPGGGPAHDPLFRYLASRLDSFGWILDRSSAPCVTDAFHELFMSVPFGVWIARVSSGGGAPSALDYAGAIVRLADAGSTPLAAKATGSGVGRSVFRRRGAWMRAMAWACGAAEGTRIELPGIRT